MYLVYNRHCVLFWEMSSYLKELTICLERQICKKILIIGIKYELLALKVHGSQAQWHMPEILAPWEPETEGLQV